MTDGTPSGLPLPSPRGPAHDLVDAVVAEHECARLIALYTHYIDLGEAARVSELFTADGIWESARGRLAGREEIERAFGLRQRNRRRRSRHVCTNTVVHVISDAEASAITYYVLYRREDNDPRIPCPVVPPLAIGEYRDRFRRAAEGWRFAHRRVTVAYGLRPRPREMVS
jgi:hypothetical protein